MSNTNKHFHKNGTEVIVDPKRDFEYYIKKFNKKVQKSGILAKVFEKRYYEPPSEKRKRKKKESLSRRIKEERKEQKYVNKVKKYISKGINPESNFSEY